MISFKVSQSAGSESHNITVTMPAYEEASLQQRRKMYQEGIDGVTIKVQGSLRRRLAKGIKGAALQAEAQSAWDAILNGTKQAVQPVFDAKGTTLTLEQVSLFETQGFKVVNYELAEIAEAKAIEEQEEKDQQEYDEQDEQDA